MSADFWQPFSRKGEYPKFGSIFHGCKALCSDMLPYWARLYFWGVHGIFIEVVFTSVWEYVVTGDLALKGASSMWAFFVYGLGTLLLAEPVCDILTAWKVHLLMRCCVYVLFTYMWEFSFGCILSYFKMCPWDYSAFNFNFLGLITLEYAPAWYLGGLYFEQLYQYLQSLERSAAWKRYSVVESDGDLVQSTHIVTRTLIRTFSGTNLKQSSQPVMFSCSIEEEDESDDR